MSVNAAFMRLAVEAISDVLPEGERVMAVVVYSDTGDGVASMAFDVASARVQRAVVSEVVDASGQKRLHHDLVPGDASELAGEAG